MKKIKKNQKPIEKDATFRYVCPNSNCKFDHWISLRQAKTKNYKIVCECGTIFQPKRIFKLKILYKSVKKNSSSKIEKVSTDAILNSKPSIPEKFKQISIGLLVKYGFSEIESNDLVEKAFNKNPESNVATFIKYILSHIKELESNHG